LDRQKFQQRRAIKFCVKLGESATVAYGEIPYPGHKSFSKGREQVEDEPRAGRPSTSETDDNVEE
jgi:hypothetical protein